MQEIDLNIRQNFNQERYSTTESIYSQFESRLLLSGSVENIQLKNISVDYLSQRQDILNKLRQLNINFIESLDDEIIVMYDETGVGKMELAKQKRPEILDRLNIKVSSNKKNSSKKIKSVNILCNYGKSSNWMHLTDYINNISTEEKEITVRWVVDNQGRSFEISSQFNQKMTDSLYPFIKEGVESYVDKFLNSPQPILILIGEPGGGKTSLIRYILTEMGKKAYVTFDENVMANDYVFGEFIDSVSSGAFVVEDADTLLRSRQDNNKLMAKFLNVSDGLISLGDKKLIFTTNLPSTKDIDPALMRPGRCFDVVNFRKLTVDEANKVCSDFKLEKLTENKSYTLAEIFNREEVDKEEIESRGFGFLGNK